MAAGAQAERTRGGGQRLGRGRPLEGPSHAHRRAPGCGLVRPRPQPRARGAGGGPAAVLIGRGAGRTWRRLDGRFPPPVGRLKYGRGPEVLSHDAWPWQWQRASDIHAEASDSQQVEPGAGAGSPDCGERGVGGRVRLADLWRGRAVGRADSRRLRRPGGETAGTARHGADGWTPSGRPGALRASRKSRGWEGPGGGPRWAVGAALALVSGLGGSDTGGAGQETLG